MIFQEKCGAVVFGQQEAQNEFFKSCNKLKPWIFYFVFLFFINLQQCEGWKLGKIILGNSCFGAIGGKKALKRAQNAHFLKSFMAFQAFVFDF